MDRVYLTQRRRGFLGALLGFLSTDGQRIFLVPASFVVQNESRAMPFRGGFRGQTNNGCLFPLLAREEGDEFLEQGRIVALESGDDLLKL
jgi:hypothetical protein